MSKRLTSIRLDESMLNEFLLELVKFQELSTEKVGFSPFVRSIEELSVTEQVHMALSYATGHVKQKNRDLRELDTRS